MENSNNLQIATEQHIFIVKIIYNTETIDNLCKKIYKLRTVQKTSVFLSAHLEPISIA